MKKSILFLLSSALLISLTACGGSEEKTETTAAAVTTTQAAEETEAPTAAETTAAAVTGEQLEAALWTLNYDPEVWTYEEDDFRDSEDYSRIMLIIPDESGDSYEVNVEIQVSIEDAEDFRSYLNSYGFDAYEYAVNQSYDLTSIGGVDCLKQEGNYWGSPCLRYFNRVEGAGVTVFIEILGEYEDERVTALLSGLTFTLTDTGNVDFPWPWDGEPFSAEDTSVTVGTSTLNSQWLPIQDCITTFETFEHDAAAANGKIYLLVDGTFKQYAFDGSALTFEEDIDLGAEYTNISAAEDGSLWLSAFGSPLICWKDGTITASYDGLDYVSMNASGSWGISWFSGPDCEKVTISDGTMSTSAISFPEVSIISTLMVGNDEIYVCGSSAEDSSHKVFVYDPDGNLKLTLAGPDDDNLGSVTFVAKTGNGYLALDGNMREIVLWTSDGTPIGKAEDSDLFGTYYPWFCGGTVLEDGSVLALMTEDRADESAMELVAFKLSGF